jgi:preprotein translocase subunit SecA
MRMFGSERIAKIMDRMGIKEGEVIQHSMITKSIERAQKKVEENNFGIRKRLLEYDDVMNAQREVIYKKRKHALFGERLSIDISNMMYDAIEQVVSDHQDSRNFDGFRMELLKIFAMDSPFDEKEYLSLNKEKITEKIFSDIFEAYRRKNDVIRERAMPVIKDVFENNSQYENIAIPVSDGIKEMQVVANLKRAYENSGQEVILAVEKGISLSHIDNAWKEHLRELDDLKQSVQTATYEQKDPLLIYKFESFELFKAMVQKTNRDIASFLVRGQLPGQQANVRQAQQPRRTDMSRFKEERSDLLSQSYANTQQQQVTQPVKREKKVGRNDPCPCGSGKKYKNCHGKE